MNQRNLGIWLLPILAAFAIYFPVSSGSGSQPQISGQAIQKGQNRSPQEVQPAEDIPGLGLLEQFFGVKDPASARVLAGDYELEFIIATVPDPAGSGLGYTFDRHVAAIQIAAGAANYILERQEMPWSQTGNKGENGKEAESEVVLQDLANKSRKADLRVGKRPLLPEPAPGVILFRGKDSQNKLLLIFLVGETPTAGIDKIALTKSLKGVENLCLLGRNPSCGKYNLLAPTFSGSVDSLRIAIANWRENEPNSSFKIISGSSTAIDKNCQLNLLHVEFSATVLNDNHALALLRGFAGVKARK